MFVNMRGCVVAATCLECYQNADTSRNKESASRFRPGKYARTYLSDELANDRAAFEKEMNAELFAKHGGVPTYARRFDEDEIDKADWPLYMDLGVKSEEDVGFTLINSRLFLEDDNGQAMTSFGRLAQSFRAKRAAVAGLDLWRISIARCF